MSSNCSWGKLTTADSTALGKLNGDGRTDWLSEHGDIMDASLKYGTFESPGRTQALFPAPEDFAHRRSYMPMINHGHDFETYLWRNLCRSEDHTVTAPPPSLASSSASTSRSNSFDEACYSGLRQYHL